MKDGVDGERWGFKLRVVDLEIDEDGDQVTSCVVEHMAEMPGDGIKPLRTAKQKEAWKVAKEFLSDGAKLEEDICEEWVLQGINTRAHRTDSGKGLLLALRNAGYVFFHAPSSYSLKPIVSADSDWVDG